MSIYAKVIADSVNPYGNRLTTFEVGFPRIILAEVNTHRMLSRNYRSSRAVPTEKLIKEVSENPFMPVYWGKNQPGMQAAEELTGEDLEEAQGQWFSAAVEAADRARSMLNMGVHKQIVNRVLEPFLYVYGVISATEWNNFYTLRDHPDAQPEFRVLAQAMRKAQQESTPVELRASQWHLPYIDEEDREVYGPEEYKKVSAARCARVSYKVFDADRKPTLEEDIALYNKLVGAQPFHASPLEHVAAADSFNSYQVDYGWGKASEHGNFRGFRQFRKMLPGEYVKG